jgi:hypothetical protein
MVESAARRPSVDPVVRPMRRTGQRICSRPGCSLPADATLTFAYEARSARIQALTERVEPEAYDLCGDHADRTNPPHGWSLADDRPDEPIQPGKRPRDLGSDRTVAVLAAALRGHAGVQDDLLASPDEDLPTSPDDDADFDDEVLAAITDIATTEPVTELDTERSPSPTASPSPAPGWQVPAARH